MPFGPWIQDPDITVGCGRARTLRMFVNDLGQVHHTGTWTESTVTVDTQSSTAPAISAAEDDNAEDYDYTVAATPVSTARTVTVNGSHVTPAGGGEYFLFGTLLQEAMLCNAEAHGWSPPAGAQVEGDADPVVIQGHVVLLHEQVSQVARTPDHTAPAALQVYQHDATPDGHVVTGTQSLIANYSGQTWLETPATNSITTTVDLAGDALNAVVFNPFLLITASGWAFGSIPNPSAEIVQQFFLTDVDDDNSFYVWRPPRYRMPLVLAEDPARRLWPRDNADGPAIGHNFPPSATQQAGRRFGSGAPL